MDSWEIEHYESAIELEKNLGKNSFLFSEEVSESNKFIKFSNNLSEVGFIYYDIGLEPQIKLLPQSNKVFLGINSIFACIDYTTKSVLFEEKLPSLLYDILIDSVSNYIIYVCELDIFIYKNDGSFLWKMGFRDIIEDYYLEGNDSISIECSDGENITFSLVSGKVR
ncbi:hypothetical protein UAY_02968 [Enterococcus moraviensis ATCC BAA-383]|uniref:Uncharacterized protein n=1 Tax=Enterococcus moraviensis ATCC BAA-383 TaxID=1158609 RepID=R2SN59_9ENTE|nr:hypothetical protein [Enterococcus moraviensis]EOH96600.1 hypothetical protein UAY_02968 [Enterococcus moraviensis ATCC BAA-383]EOT66026.1 hypothetical protein I586_02295 [Enterococcus moraviensis ATCC BAA-383]OJG68203.1 hypothetical protein RV09_GL001450 [Enterococcus moraviensis]